MQIEYSHLINLCPQPLCHMGIYYSASMFQYFGSYQCDMQHANASFLKKIRCLVPGPNKGVKGEKNAKFPFNLFYFSFCLV